MKSILKKLTGKTTTKKRYRDRHQDQKIQQAIVLGDYPFIMENFNDLLSQPTHFFYLAIENHHSFIAWLLLRTCQMDISNIWFILFTRKQLFITLKLMLELGLHEKIPLEQSLHLCQDLETLRYCILYCKKPENIHWVDSLLVQNKRDLLQSPQLPQQKAGLAQTIEIKKLGDELEQAYTKICSQQGDLKDSAIILFLANLKFGYDFLKQQIKCFPEEIIVIILNYLVFNMFTSISSTYAHFDYFAALNSSTIQTESFSLSQFFIKYNQKKSDKSLTDQATIRMA